MGWSGISLWLVILKILCISWSLFARPLITWFSTLLASGIMLLLCLSSHSSNIISIWWFLVWWPILFSIVLAFIVSTLFFYSSPVTLVSLWWFIFVGCPLVGIWYSRGSLSSLWPY